jgi:hypothetical protein
MKRFDCPGCGKSLRFRLLPHVPGAHEGEPTFSCIHCRTVLGYNKGPVDALLWGNRLRSLVTLLATWTLLYLVSAGVGFRATLGLIAVLAVALIAVHGFSARPAYRLVGGPNPPR